jgi:hypothetical protein
MVTTARCVASVRKQQTAGGDQPRDPHRWRRKAEQEIPAWAATALAQERRLLAGFDAFGHHREIEIPRRRQTVPAIPASIRPAT